MKTMFNIQELFENGRLQLLARLKDKKRMIEYLLKSENIKAAIEHLDTKYLHCLDVVFYEMPVEGYMSLYDYLINTRDEKIELLQECYQSRKIYIPHILKYKSFKGMFPLLITTGI